MAIQLAVHVEHPSFRPEVNFLEQIVANAGAVVAASMVAGVIVGYCLIGLGAEDGDRVDDVAGHCGRMPSAADACVPVI